MSESARQAERIVVPAVRMPRWLGGFAHRNGAGDVTVQADADGWLVSAGLGRVHVLEPCWPGAKTRVDNPGDLALVAAAMDYLVLVVRRAGYLVATIEGGQVSAGRSSGRHINGRSAAGGWSQKRFERRRGNQADEVAAAAAAQLAQLMVESAPAFLATGGDRPLVVAALNQLYRIQQGQAFTASALPRGPHFQIGTPSRSDIAGLPERVTGVVIEVLPDLGV